MTGTSTPPRRWAAFAAAVGAGVGAGLLGTSLHGHAWYPNGVGSAIPYGAGLALLLLAAVSMFVGLWSRSSWIAVWCGAAAYLTAGLLSLQIGSAGMIFDNIPGRVWLYGIAFTTPLMAWLTWVVLRPRRARRK
ncbi:hypothetical protein AAGW05_11065 [Arthrobacter sp. LAPM80]|uniref:hypothetical protein n=1 Tax=Arthrobacter sp. LAPM80 TaxID=3141788 RepID=UPI00398B1F0B